MGFGLFNILLVLTLFRNSINEHGERILRYLVVVTVITGTIVLVTAGYSNDQIAPAFGLFGTIIGYFLGRLTQSPDARGAKAEGAPGPGGAGRPNLGSGSGRGGAS